MKYKYDKEDGAFQAEAHVINDNFTIEALISNCSYNFIVLRINMNSFGGSINYFYNLKTDKYTTTFTYKESAVGIAGYVSMGKDFSNDEVFVHPNSYIDSPLATDRAIRDFVASIKVELIINALLDN